MSAGAPTRQHAAPGEAGQHRRQRGQPPMRLLQAQHAVLADYLDQSLGGEAAGGQELGMRAAVRDAEKHVRVADDFLQVV